ncbi:hypothetical protein AO715_02685 [Xanthomonas sp. Mitacek01]|nr:hypothetical protein AO715_02685 [Xanthomonas sp. Mitacek01]
MLIAGIVFVPLAIVMAVLAFSGVAGAATNIAWILFVLLLLGGGGLMLLALVLHLWSMRTPKAL